MTDRKTYMREYMRRRRASSANSADVNSAHIPVTITSLREVIRQEVEQAIQPLLVQLTKLTVNSVSNGIPPAAAAQVPAKLPPPYRIPGLASQAKNLHTQGLSWVEIAKQWNAQSIPTLSGKGQWHGATVARLVSMLSDLVFR
jgi:hypothetical protein